jgi:hypothetical protein
MGTWQRRTGGGYGHPRHETAHSIRYELFQKPMLNVDAIFEAHVFVALAIAFHRAAGGTGCNTGEEYCNCTKHDYEAFHLRFDYR